MEAIWYFAEQIAEWSAQEAERQKPARLVAISEAILQDLQLVSISLGEQDDAQVIFETLNGHGAQLHATDLIRNFIFMRADREGAAGGELFDNLWSQFEGGFWADAQRRGRLQRPRLEWFIQTAIQAVLGEEVEIGRLYASYRRNRRLVSRLLSKPLRSVRSDQGAIASVARSTAQTRRLRK